MFDTSSVEWVRFEPKLLTNLILKAHSSNKVTKDKELEIPIIHDRSLLTRNIGYVMMGMKAVDSDAKHPVIKLPLI